MPKIPALLANIQFFHLETIDTSDLETKLSNRAFVPCQSSQAYSMGWVPPLDLASLHHREQGAILLRLRKQEKVLPQQAIKEAVQAKQQEIEKDREQPLSRKERLALKNEITNQLILTALVKSTYFWVVIDPQQGWLMVDTASSAVADEVVSFLRGTLGALSTSFPVIAKDPDQVMTSWVEKSPPDGYLLGNAIELRQDEEVVRCKNIQLDKEEVLTHIKAGKYVTQLELEWGELLTFTLTNLLSIRLVRPTELLAIEDDDESSNATLLAAKFAALLGPVRQLLKLLTHEFK